MDVYARAAREAGVRVVARVLPVPESLAACAAAGLEPRDIVAMQGPTTAELDAALLRHLGASVLVTKDSGDAGGLGEKLRAAELAGATAIVVERPGRTPRPATAARTAPAGAAEASDAAGRARVAGRAPASSPRPVASAGARSPPRLAACCRSTPATAKARRRPRPAWRCAPAAPA